MGRAKQTDATCFHGRCMIEAGPPVTVVQPETPTVIQPDTPTVIQPDTPTVIEPDMPTVIQPDTPTMTPFSRPAPLRC